MRFPEFNDEWEQTTLGEVATFCGGGTPSSKSGSYWDGNIPWISSSDIQNGNISNINITRFISSSALKYSSTKLCKAPCIVIVSRVGVGKVAYSEIDICTSQDFCNLTDIQAEHHFLAYLLQPLMERKSVEVQGTSIKGVTMEEIKHIVVSLPSLAEQQKIASFLSLLDERIETQRQTIEERKAQKKALLQQIFSQSLRFPEFEDEWKQTTLGEVCQIIGGGTPSTEVDTYWGGNIPWFTPSEIRKKYIRHSERTITDEGLNNSGARLLPKGAILLTTRATIGECAISTTPCCTNQGFQSLVVNLNKSTTEFIYQKVQTLRNELLIRANGSTFKEITAQEIKGIHIFIPSLKEQQKIADFLSLLDERIEVEEELLQKYEAQKRYLLRKMFV